MKRLNKKLIAVAVAITLTSSAGIAFAKSGMNNQADPATRLNYIFTQLALTETQQADVLAVLEAAQEEQRQAMWETRQAMQNQAERPTQEQRDAMREAHRAAQTQLITDKLNTVLSPEVTADLVEYLDAHQGMGRDMNDRKGGMNDRNGKGDNRGQGQGQGQGQNRGQAAPAN